LASLPRAWKDAVGQRFQGLRNFIKTYKVERILLAIDGFAGFVLVS
jgi:hypothetical protein